MPDRAVKAWAIKLKNGRFWKGDDEVATAFSSRKNAMDARNRMVFNWTGYERIFAASTIVPVIFREGRK